MAQTFNMGRYMPPEVEGQYGVSHNTASGKSHALGARARKLKSEGILIVRFECPFPIWCTNCQPETIIAQGVRFNAEKKEVGKYYSTKIWSFRIKHTVCGGWIEVRTDPKNAEYVVVDGGRRRDYGETRDSLVEDGLRVGSGISEAEKDQLEKEGGFAALEKKVADKQEHDSQQKRLDELTKRSDKDWSDPYEKSRILRREFRVGRRQRQADEKSGDALKERYGIGIELLAPEEMDAERSKYVSFGDVRERSASVKPLFDSVSSKSDRPFKDVIQERGKRAKQDEIAISLQKSNLQSALRGNTRGGVDPFLKDTTAWTPGIKRKRVQDEDDAQSEKDAPEEVPTKVRGAALVDYDSESS